MDIPDFLQMKQNASVRGFKESLFGDRKKTLSIVGMLVVLLAIPLTVWFAQKTQIFSPKADSTAIQLVTGIDTCVLSNDPNKVNCPSFPIKLTSPLGPEESAQPSATSSASPLQSASPSASGSAEPSPSALASSSPISTPSASPVNIASCMSTKLGLGSPLTTPNKNNTTILYWRSTVTLAALKTAATECGASLLKPDNFTSSALETMVRNAGSNPTRAVHVEGPCNATKVAEYRTNGVKTSDDTQCNPGDGELAYKVYPAANIFDGIGDFGGNGDPAVVIPASGSFTEGKGLVNFIAAAFRGIFKDASAQTASPSLAPSSSPSPTTVGCTSDNQCGQGNTCWNHQNYPGQCLPNGSVCAGVMAPACNPNGGQCVDFPSPCHVPPGWTLNNNQASPSASVVLSPPPLAHPWTIYYKMAETEAGLAGAVVYPYDAHPKFTDFTFTNTTPGMKQVWVEFIGPEGDSRTEHISVELVEPDPQITSLNCSMDITKQNLKLTLNGARLGSSGGKVVVGGKDAQITSWNSTQVTADINPEGDLSDGKLFKVKLTKSDNKELPEITCQVNTTLISLGARLFCREVGKFDVTGVKITLVDENGGRINEEVTIDANGIIKGLKTKLQVGKAYAISIKAPYSIRTNAEFVAANGTNVITPDDGNIFILPVGDIAPTILSDGKINTLDRSEIVRQWAVLGSTTKTADFNRDTRVNSIDWACMRFDFNKEDQPIPARAGATEPTFPEGCASQPPAPVCASGLVPVFHEASDGVCGLWTCSAPSSSPSPTLSPTPSPQASGQRSAYFLLEPLEGGTYPDGDEFIVNVNIWSQLTAANLFAAKLSFDPTALEVVRIEKGTVLSSWAEEFFNNQTGAISLVAGKTSPGILTVEGDDPLMAKVIFRAKKPGNTTITVTSDSRIFSNDNNTNILTSLLSAEIEITD